MGVVQVDIRSGPLTPGFAELFHAYRRHYGQSGILAESTSWLQTHLEDGALIGFHAEVAGQIVGFALVASVPASQRLSHFWQLRDLFVTPSHRRKQAASQLVSAVRDAAAAAGALRLVLQTELDNTAAINLYERLGFERVEGYVGLALSTSGLR